MRKTFFSFHVYGFSTFEDSFSYLLTSMTGRRSRDLPLNDFSHALVPNTGQLSYSPVPRGLCPQLAPHKDKLLFPVFQSFLMEIFKHMEAESMLHCHQ